MVQEKLESLGEGSIDDNDFSKFNNMNTSTAMKTNSMSYSITASIQASAGKQNKKEKH